jgi:hypothetical protein
MICIHCGQCCSNKSFNYGHFLVCGLEKLKVSALKTLRLECIQHTMVNAQAKIEKYYKFIIGYMISLYHVVSFHHLYQKTLVRSSWKIFYGSYSIWMWVWWCLWKKETWQSHLEVLSVTTFLQLIQESTNDRYACKTQLSVSISSNNAQYVSCFNLRAAHFKPMTVRSVNQLRVACHLMCHPAPANCVCFCDKCFFWLLLLLIRRLFVRYPRKYKLKTGNQVSFGIRCLVLLSLRHRNNW